MPLFITIHKPKQNVGIPNGKPLLSQMELRYTILTLCQLGYLTKDHRVPSPTWQSRQRPARRQKQGSCARAEAYGRMRDT